jgi:uncharacterized protein (TIGR00251 family)
MIEIQSTSDGLTFWVVVQPRTSRVAIIGEHQNALKIKLTAPPVDSAANKQCLEVLAKVLERPKSTLSIVGGHTSRRKQILIRAKTGPMPASEKQALERQLGRLGKGGGIG